MAAAAGEYAEQSEVDLVPYEAGEAAAAPEVSPGQAAAGAASACGGWLVFGQDAAERGEGVGVVAGSFQFGELVPYRVDRVASVGVELLG
jgi:hypothetical protein